MKSYLKKHSRNISLMALTVLTFLLFSPLDIVKATTYSITSPPFNAACNGVTDDVFAVQLALNTLATGDTLLIPGPTAIGSPGLTIQYKNLIFITGTSPNSGFIALTGNYLHISGYTHNQTLLRIILSNNVTIQNLIIEGNNFDFTPVCFGETQHCVIRGCSIRNIHTNLPPPDGSLAGIASQKSSYLTVANNHIHHLTSDTTDGPRGLWLGGVHSGFHDMYDVVTSNVIEHTKATSIAIHAAIVTIDSNTVRYSEGSGIKINSSHDIDSGLVLIRNNTLSNHLFHAVQLNSVGTSITLHNVYIEENVIDSITDSGIHLFSPTKGMVIRKNTIQNTAQSNCNVLYNFTEGGIYITASVDSLIISDNTIINSCGQGIGLDNEQNIFTWAEIKNIHIFDNMISNIDYHGIRIRKGATSEPIDSITIRCNEINNVTGAALQIENGGNIGNLFWCFNSITQTTDTFNFINYLPQSLIACTDTCDILSTLFNHPEVSLRFVIYPNPVSDNFHLKFSSHPKKEILFTIYDTYGRAIFMFNVTPDINRLKIPVSHLTNGVFLLHGSDGNNSYMQRIVINH